MPTVYDENSDNVEIFQRLGDGMYEELGRDAAAFLLLDLNQRGSPVAYASSSMLDLFEYDLEDIIGRPWTALCGDETDVDDMRSLESAVFGTEDCSRCIICPTKNGEVFWNHIYLEPGSQYGVTYTCISCHDVTPLVENRGETAVNVDVVEEASRIQALQISTVKTVLGVLSGLMGVDQDRDNEQSVGGQIGAESEEMMVRLKAALTNNNFEGIRSLLLDTEGAVLASMEMRASFSLEIHDNGQERQVCVNQGNALHYAICRSAFSAALALIICCPELIGMECHWGEEVLESEVENEAPTRRLRSFNAVQLANRYGEFFEESNTDLSQLYFSTASIMQYYAKVCQQLAAIGREPLRNRLEDSTSTGESLLVELMQLTAYQITRGADPDEIGA